MSNFGLETKLEADTELIKNRLFLAFNVLYEPEGTNTFPGWTPTNRPSVFRQRSLFRSSPKSLSERTSGICATMKGWVSTHLPATAFFWARPFSGKSAPRC